MGFDMSEHVLVRTLAAVIAAHHELSEAVIACSDRHGTRAAAQLLGVSHQTVQRWRTETPGLASLVAAREAARRAGCG